MRFTTASTLLLLLPVADFAVGKALPKSSTQQRETSFLGYVSSELPLGENTLDEYPYIAKRAGVLVPKLGGAGAAFEGGAAEAGAAAGGVRPHGPESNSGEVQGGEHPNTETSGGDRSPNVGTDSGVTPGDKTPSPPTPDLEPRTAVAPKLDGMTEADSVYWDTLTEKRPRLDDHEEMMLWSGTMEDEADLRVYDLQHALVTKLPEKEYISSFEMKERFEGWEAAGKKWEEQETPEIVHKQIAISSMKFAEVAANNDKPLHILYENPTVPDAPELSMLTMGELPIVTGPGSKIPVIYRWNLDTFEKEIGGETPQFTEIWRAGDRPMGELITDLSVDTRPE